ncbi:MAG TPA: acyltransferase [Oculatellaceae cyanobacterium]|jgi:peptidoglycan/LPS O-acetylase OafA/YrhL
MGQPYKHIKYLEGLRGISSVYVTVGHFTVWGLSTESSLFNNAFIWASFGHFAVGVFIVLSGYCLMLPVVLSTEKQLKGGVIGYLQRRAKRILPPYYAALILGVVMLILSPAGLKSLIHGIDNPAWLANFDPGNLVSHVFLVHNLNPDWNHSIIRPMWSVSTEWEIYFLFPILLLPIWRYCGTITLLLVALLVGISPHYLLPSEYNLDWACPWYLELFALGMLGAQLTSSKEFYQEIYIKCLPALIILGISIYIPIYLRLSEDNWLIDVFGGTLALAIILYCNLLSNYNKASHKYNFLSFLESKLLIKISKFSYSLYLVHFVVLIKLFEITKIYSFPLMGQIFLRVFVGIPAAFIFCYLFYFVFERPFIKPR